MVHGFKHIGSVYLQLCAAHTKNSFDSENDVVTMKTQDTNASWDAQQWILPRSIIVLEV